MSKVAPFPIGSLRLPDGSEVIKPVITTVEAAGIEGQWRCWCGAARVNPYGRPTFDGCAPLKDCNSCGGLVIVGANYDAAAATKKIIDSNLF